MKSTAIARYMRRRKIRKPPAPAIPLQTTRSLSVVTQLASVAWLPTTVSAPGAPKIPITSTVASTLLRSGYWKIARSGGVDPFPCAGELHIFRLPGSPEVAPAGFVGHFPARPERYALSREHRTPLDSDEALVARSGTERG